MAEVTTLLPSDPTVFTVCESCNNVRKGLAQPQYFGKAFSAIEFKKGPKCDNCKGELTVIGRIRAPRRRGGR